MSFALKSRKRVSSFIAITSAASLVLVSACSSDSADGSTSTEGGAGENETRVALVAGGPSTYFTFWEAAGLEAQEEYGIQEVKYEVPPTPEYDPTIQINSINSLLSAGYNAFGIFPDGATALQTTYDKMEAQGIPVIDIGGCSEEPTAALFCLATDVKAAAYYETQELIKAMGGEGKIALLTGLLTDNNTILRNEGVEEAVAETNGAVEITQIISDIDTPNDAPAAVQSLLANHGHELDGMISPTYYPSVAAASIMMENPEYQDILFIGTDNDPTVMKAIQEGAIYGTIYQNSAGQATIAAYVLNRIVADGCEIAEDAPFDETPQTTRFIDSGYILVGQDDIEDYIGGPESIPEETERLLGEMDSYLTCPGE